MIVTLDDGTTMQCEDESFAEGGEGKLFWGADGKHVIKLYKNVEPQREAALRKIIGAEYSVVLNEPYWDELFAWPKAIIKKPCLGLTMLRAPKGTMELDWFLGGRKRRVVASRYGPTKLGRWSNSLSLAIKMARVVCRMHFRGLCHSDLSFRNFLVDPPNNRVVLIDCDGLVVPGFLPPNVLGTPGCMAPELMAQLTSTKREKVLPSWRTDLHALAVLVYWLLFQRHPLLGPRMNDPDPGLDEALALGERALFIEHPTDHANRPKVLPMPFTDALTPAVQDLMIRALVKGVQNPVDRPQAADWERFLVRMVDSVVVCPKPDCPVGSFILQPGKPAACPVCKTPLRNPPFVPIFNFYTPQRGRKGQFQNDRGYIMVGWPGREIKIWHARSDQQPGRPGIDQGTKGRLHFDAGHRKWYLENTDLPDMRVLENTGSQEVGPGKRVELSDGARVLLGPPDECRLVYVQMLALK